MADVEKVIRGIECCLSATKHEGCPYESDNDIYNTCTYLMLNDALELLKELSITGHWIEKEDYNFDIYYDCSECGESWTTIDGTPWQNGMNYCPHCGSRMKLEQS